MRHIESTPKYCRNLRRHSDFSVCRRPTPNTIATLVLQNTDIALILPNAAIATLFSPNAEIRRKAVLLK